MSLLKTNHSRQAIVLMLQMVSDEQQITQHTKCCKMKWHHHKCVVNVGVGTSLQEQTHYFSVTICAYTNRVPASTTAQHDDGQLLDFTSHSDTSHARLANVIIQQWRIKNYQLEFNSQFALALSCIAPELIQPLYALSIDFWLLGPYSLTYDTIWRYVA